jgi:hypothetical protein
VTASNGNGLLQETQATPWVNGAPVWCAPPPSSYAIAGAIEGHPGAWWRVTGATLARGALIAPGLRLAGVKGWTLLWASLLGSAGVTISMFVYYSLRRAQSQQIPPSTG